MPRCERDGAELIVQDGYYVCPACGRLYGPAEPPERRGSPEGYGVMAVKARRYVDPLADVLEVPEPVRVAAAQILGAYMAKARRGGSAYLAAACLILAGSKLGYPIPPSEALEGLRGLLRSTVRPRKLLKGMGEVQSILGIKNDLSPVSYIPALIRILSRTSPGDPDPEAIRLRATRILKEAEQRDRFLIVGKNPRHLAAVAVLLALEELGFERLSRFIKILGVGKSRFRETARLLKPEREEEKRESQVGRAEGTRSPREGREAGYH